MDKVNSAKEMGSSYVGVLMFYVPVLYAIRTRFLKRTKLGIFFWFAEYLFPVLLSLLLANIEIISFDSLAAESYGKIRSDLEKAGNPIGPLDMMIAGHAKSLKYTVVTNNTKEFERVQGLKLENWAK